MARTADRFQLHWRGESRGWTVRFTHDGKQLERSTGIKVKRSKAEATRAAAQIYAAEINGQPNEARRAPRTSAKHDLSDALADWIEYLPLRGVTAELYGKYAGYWAEQWEYLEQMTESAVRLYVSSRLREATGKSVANEASAMRSFFRWCVDSKLLPSLIPVPSVPKSSGTPSKMPHRVAAPELTPEECWAVIAALPERSARGGWPIRARCIVGYVLSLRPATLDQLSVPEHYSRGSSTLVIPGEIDKEGYARQIPLPPLARDALDSVCPESGPIFGRHRLGPYVRPAARKVLPPHKAEVFIAQHLRSASITHSLERTSNLPGVQYLAGHKHASTTARYVRPSFRAALEVANSWSEAPILGTGFRDEKSESE